jgi:hypothetical protein
MRPRIHHTFLVTFETGLAILAALVLVGGLLWEWLCKSAKRDRRFHESSKIQRPLE